MVIPEWLQRIERRYDYHPKTMVERDVDTLLALVQQLGEALEACLKERYLDKELDRLVARAKSVEEVRSLQGAGSLWRQAQKEADEKLADAIHTYRNGPEVNRP